MHRARATIGSTMTHAHRSATPISTHDTTRIDDTRIKAVRPLITPALLQEWLPTPDAALTLVESSRAALSRILHGQDDRLVVVVGPCSIHDHGQAMEYARQLKVQAEALQDDLLVVMRVYFEKPRTTVGWKGYINDPHLDGSFAINEGLEMARALLLDVLALGLPVGTEFLDLLSPQYISDLVSWGAIGARTTESQRLRDDLLLVMRVYFEKPRTTVGWKGYINDPHLDGSYAINEGLQMARRLLLDVLALGLPVGCEFLDLLSPQFISDLVSWGAIGARTTESQSHRQLASGLSCPVGFKNGTDGGVKVAADAIVAARAPHAFLGLTKMGQAAVFETRGNDDCHVILRGGKAPNYSKADVDAACALLRAAGLREQVMIDVSHANSSKQHARQIAVAHDVAAQVAAGDARILGLMIESHLEEGRQDIVPGQPLERGVSVTDACISFAQTEPVLEALAAAVRARRAA